jgi:hypothetical protein
VLKGGGNPLQGVLGSLGGLQTSIQNEWKNQEDDFQQFGKDVCKRVVTLEDSRKALVGTQVRSRSLGPSPRGRGLGHQASQSLQNSHQHVLFIGPEFIIPEPHNFPAIHFQKFRTMGIIGLFVLMLSTVQLND